MHDLTVSGIPGERGDQCAISRRKVLAWAAGQVHDDDELLARVLISTWALATGRILRGDVPPQMLSASELLDFWADEQMTADHAAGAGHLSPVGPQ